MRRCERKSCGKGCWFKITIANDDLLLYRRFCVYDSRDSGLRDCGRFNYNYPAVGLTQSQETFGSRVDAAQTTNGIQVTCITPVIL